jgi:hypothetical protein
MGGITPESIQSEFGNECDHNLVRDTNNSLAKSVPCPARICFWVLASSMKQPVTAKVEALDVPAHETLEAVYREFRRVVPQGRFSIWVGCTLHPKTFRPQGFLALDSQLCDKAFAAPTPLAPSKPA